MVRHYYYDFVKISYAIDKEKRKKEQARRLYERQEAFKKKQREQAEQQNKDIVDGL